MRRNPKLYELTSEGFRLPLHVDHLQNVLTYPAVNVPMMFWPDGTSCVPANIYMIELLRRGLSKKYGGTLRTYACNISQFLRFCANNQIDLRNITDAQFSLFIKTLQGERRASNPSLLARNSNATIAIGRRCLDFLVVIGEFYRISEIVGPEGQVLAFLKTWDRPTRKGFVNLRGRRAIRYWTHHSFPEPTAKDKRMPITARNIDRLRDAVLTLGGSVYLRKRRYAMLSSLQFTGGRRSEVSDLTVASVYEASKMDYPLLKMSRAKMAGGREAFKYVPITRPDIDALVDFIEVNRQRVIRTTCGKKMDDGYVFVNERTGKKLVPNTITEELSTLAKAAGIKERIHPHMFRHRYGTMGVVGLVEQHEKENPTEPRRRLLDLEKIKRKLMEFMGLSSTAAVDVYIDTAFEELAGLSKSTDTLRLKFAIESTQGIVLQLLGEINGGASPKYLVHRLQQLLSSLKSELASSVLAD